MHLKYVGGFIVIYPIKTGDNIHEYKPLITLSNQNLTFGSETAIKNLSFYGKTSNKN